MRSLKIENTWKFWVRIAGSLVLTHVNSWPLTRSAEVNEVKHSHIDTHLASKWNNHLPKHPLEVHRRHWDQIFLWCAMLSLQCCRLTAHKSYDWRNCILSSLSSLRHTHLLNRHMLLKNSNDTSCSWHQLPFFHFITFATNNVQFPFENVLKY